MRTRPRFLLVLAFLVTLSSASAGAAVPHLSPSNSDTAFRQVPLLTPSGGSGYVTGVGHLTWPTFLDSTLQRSIGSGDSVLVASTRTKGVRIGLNGSVTYTFPANTYANRVGAIVTADDWTDPTESTLPMLIASFTFADGRTWGTGTLYDINLDLGYPFLLYYRVRNWSDQVVPGDPDFVTKPLNPAVIELCAQASNGGVGNVYSDLQTFFIPDTLRNTALQTVTFASHTTAFDSTHITSAHGLVSGLVVWPDFEIRNRHGGGLGLQTQFDPSYATKAYGGFIVRDTLFGSRRTFKAFGCMLSCMAMANSNAGDTVTVLELNKYLALNNGFKPSTHILLDVVGGQDPGASVTWTILSGSKIKVGDTLVVEDPSAPIRTAPLVTLVAGPTPTQGTIIRRHASGVIGHGMKANAYGNVDPIVASRGFSGDKGYPWHLADLGVNPKVAPSLVDAALGDSLPVLLQVVGTPTHYVVARGRRPSMGSGFARGTYLINDPGHSGVVRLNQRFDNKYFFGRSCVPDDATHYLRTSSVEDAVTFILQGGGRLGITTPDGHFLYYDETSGTYAGDIADVEAWPDYNADLDDDDPANADDPVDYIQLPSGAAGDYRVIVSTSSPSTIGLGATTSDGSGSDVRDFVAYPLVSGQAAGFVVHVVQGASPSVQIDTLGTTSVGGAPGYTGLGLLIRPNPSRGSVEMVAEMPSRGRLRLEVYDVAGRLVARPFDGEVPAGQRVVKWDGRSGGSMATHTGLYFVRMTAGGNVISRRFVVTQ